MHRLSRGLRINKARDGDEEPRMMKDKDRFENVDKNDAYEQFIRDNNDLVGVCQSIEGAANEIRNFKKAGLDKQASGPNPL